MEDVLDKAEQKEISQFLPRNKLQALTFTSHVHRKLLLFKKKIFPAVFPYVTVCIQADGK